MPRPSPEIDVEHLAELGRLARASGKIEVATKRITEILVSSVFGIGQAVVKGQQFGRLLKLSRQLAPIRIDWDGDIYDRQVYVDLTTWLTEAEGVMHKRNEYLHGYWEGGHDDQEAVLLQRDDFGFQAVPITQLRAEARHAESVADHAALIYARVFGLMIDFPVETDEEAT